MKKFIYVLLKILKKIKYNFSNIILQKRYYKFIKRIKYIRYKR